MASGKRILGTITFLVAFLAMGYFVLMLYAKSVQDFTVPFADSTNVAVVWIGIILGICICALLLAIIVRGADERRNRRLEEEEAARRAAMQGGMDAFESSLEEPEGLGKGPEMVIYNLGALPQMFRAWSRFERRTRSHPFVTPRTVESGMYTNTYIPVDDKGTQLKLRVLLAGPPNAQQGELPARHTTKVAWQPDKRALASIPQEVRDRLPAEVREKYWPTPGGAPAAEESAQMQEVATAAGGRGFVQELDATLAKRTGTNGSTGRPYYDYAGDVHNVEDIEGIGRIYGAKLADAGVHTTARLAYEDAASLARRVGVPQKTVEQWKVMGELMKIKGVGKQYAEAMARAGMDGIAELKRRSANAIANQINAYLDSLDTNVLGSKVTEKRVEAWQKAAKTMKRVRMDVPAQ